MDRVFDEHRPEVVFHAAALKHLPLLERYPDEALKSNVIGTRNVLEAANRVGARHFINISTDKAANPTSALGHSKRLAEQLTAWFALNGVGENYISVRFGNVLGSRGSVLHSFGAQIERGGPVTVTDAEATRYFMTIPEACQLVIQAGAIGRPGEALVLDMGQRVKIVDVARHMIAMSGRSIDIVFTGLRGGEKLHEQTLGSGESDERPAHPLISHVAVPPLRPDLIDEQPWAIAARTPVPCVRLSGGELTWPASCSRPPTSASWSRSTCRARSPRAGSPRPALISRPSKPRWLAASAWRTGWRSARVRPHCTWACSHSGSNRATWFSPRR